MLEIVDARKSPNYGARRGHKPVDMLVFHYTDAPDCKTAMEWLCDPAREVSAHYLVDEDGTVYRLVDEEHRAWHAGVSYWRGETDINSLSIGIEIQNPGHGNGYRPFPATQMDAVKALSLDIVDRHNIPDQNIVAHSDIAPGRKIDPGELFDWSGLAEAGVGFFPNSDSGNEDIDLLKTLSEIGYDSSAEGVISAFQRRYRPSCIDNEADSETRLLADALLQHFVRPST